MLGRYDEADEVNVQLAEYFDFDTPCANVLYELSMLNELHMNEPGLDYMRKLILARPKYDGGYLALRMLMKRHNQSLESSQDTLSDLVEAFNSDISQEEFAAILSKAKTESPKSIQYLRRRIKSQDFGEE